MKLFAGPPFLAWLEICCLTSSKSICRSGFQPPQPPTHPRICLGKCGNILSDSHQYPGKGNVARSWATSWGVIWFCVSVCYYAKLLAASVNNDDKLAAALHNKLFSHLFQPAAKQSKARKKNGKEKPSQWKEQSGKQPPYLCWKQKMVMTWAYFWEKWLGPLSEKGQATFQLLASVLFYIFEFTDILILILVWQTLYQPHFDDRREEKLYVEGMEDEDMKKETQNLAYPPAFKVSTPCLVRGYIAMCTTWAI